MSKVEKFKDNEEKKTGDNVSGEVSVYPEVQLSWSESNYLKKDEDGDGYMELHGKLIYEGLGATAKEEYLLKSELGNFRLFKDDCGKLLVRKFIPASSSRLGKK